MASFSGNASEEMKKRKRKQSNRESAKRSRIRKQKHMNDLTACITQLESNNCRIVATLQTTAQQLLLVEADNSILRAQMTELTNMLGSLKEILSYMNNSATDTHIGIRGMTEFEPMGGLNFGCVSQQPIMASTDYHVFEY